MTAPPRELVALVHTKALPAVAGPVIADLLTAGWSVVVIGPNAYRISSIPPQARLLDLDLGLPGLIGKVTRRLFGSAPWWWAAQRHPEVRQALAHARVLTAADQAAIYPVWRAARDRPSVIAVFGLQPTLDTIRAAALSPNGDVIMGQ
ncbi:MAG: hypothetical protein ACK5MP_09235 [Nostocoides sp.]